MIKENYQNQRLKRSIFGMVLDGESLDFRDVNQLVKFIFRRGISVLRAAVRILKYLERQGAQRCTAM